ncbi:MAG: hypothetical protein AB1497_06470 [Bacillota bacterium]
MPKKRLEPSVIKNKGPARLWSISIIWAGFFVLYYGGLRGTNPLLQAIGTIIMGAGVLLILLA